MNARAWLRRTALAADLLALAAFAASQGDPWTFLVAGAVVVAGFALSDGPRGLFMPGWAVRASVVAGILWGSLEFLSRPAPVEAARTVGLVVAAGMCVKAWDRRGPTDWRQSLILSVVLAVSSTLHSSDFLVGVLVMSFACAAVPSAMLLQVHSGAEAAVARLRPGGLDHGDVPLNRAGRHEELTDLAAYLVSENAGYITGECVVIDGGRRYLGGARAGVQDMLAWDDTAWEKQREKTPKK